jgi:hypothetical protein
MDKIFGKPFQPRRIIDNPLSSESERERLAWLDQFPSLSRDIPDAIRR